MLGVELSRMDSPGMDMMTFPMQREGSGATGALVKMQGFASGANSVLIYFVCKDCAKEAARAVKRPPSRDVSRSFRLAQCLEPCRGFLLAHRPQRRDGGQIFGARLGFSVFPVVDGL